ncbi:MAG: cobalamin B12-binding domain-containing protein [Chloroflexi bacterium]|nr:cobalamin B12-binding domain-containing protein [Chloroflexota bacterium]
MTGYERLSYQLEQALLALDRLVVKQILAESGQAGNIFEFTDRVIVPAMEMMGEGWEQGTIALSQYYMSSRILEETLSALLPSGTSPQRPHQKMAITILNDYHALGKRIVSSALQVNGFRLTDYGRREVDELAEAVKEDGIRVLLVSVLMLPSALLVKQLRRRLDEMACPTKIVVGGAPFRFDGQLWREVGADAMGKTASEAVEIVTELAVESG